jgi:hypothetical protein
MRNIFTSDFLKARLGVYALFLYPWVVGAHSKKFLWGHRIIVLMLYAEG